MKRTSFYAAIDKNYSLGEQEFLYKIGEEELSTVTQWLEYVNGLNHNKPWQQLVGKANFLGLDFFVNQNVLIPRPETEELVVWIQAYAQANEIDSFLDLGTGSGCIPISLAKQFPNSRVYGLDKYPNALVIAKKNNIAHATHVNWIEADLLDASLKLPQAEVWSCNPPYIRPSEVITMDQSVLQHEPEQALFVTEQDPLIFYRSCCKLAQEYLPKNGALFFEINQYLSDATKNLALQYFEEVTLKKDLSGSDRMLKCTHLKSSNSEVKNMR